MEYVGDLDKVEEVDYLRGDGAAGKTGCHTAG